jgi:hypothetical protein
MSNEAYLRSLERQIDAQRQRREEEAAVELALDRSMIRRNNQQQGPTPFSSERGGGGAPLRNTNGSVVVGVRGLLARELCGEGAVRPVATAAAATAAAAAAAAAAAQRVLQVPPQRGRG